MFFKEKCAELKAAVRMPAFPEFLCDAGVQQARDHVAGNHAVLNGVGSEIAVLMSVATGTKWFTQCSEGYD